MPTRAHFVLYDTAKRLYIRINPFGCAPDVYPEGYTSEKSEAFSYETYSGAKHAKQSLPQAYITSSLDVEMVSASR